MAKIISLTAGTSETMRCGRAGACARAAGGDPTALIVSSNTIASTRFTMSFPYQQPEKERAADQRGDDADRQLAGRPDGPRHRVAGDQERSSEQGGARQDQPMVGSDDQADQVRHNQADEADGDRQ